MATAEEGVRDHVANALQVAKLSRETGEVTMEDMRAIEGRLILALRLIDDAARQLSSLPGGRRIISHGK